MKSLLLIRELLPPEGPPAALAANGTVDAKLNGKGRFAVGVNGNGPSQQRKAAAPVNRVNGAAKKGKRREWATARTSTL